MDNNVNRRVFLTVSAGLVVGTSLLASAAPEMINADKGVTAPEELMKEHGVLNRCLLIYEEGIRRIEGRQDVSPEVFDHTAGLIRYYGKHKDGERSRAARAKNRTHVD
ncbi:MAG: hypothetical protein JWR69_4082 [Pedosphaera sp.]|nr:hypothetical protein [Pedosphaera sp.]